MKGIVVLSCLIVVGNLAAMRLDDTIKRNLKSTLGYVIKVNEKLAATNGAVISCIQMRDDVHTLPVHELLYGDAALQLYKIVQMNCDYQIAYQNAVLKTKVLKSNKSLLVKRAWERHNRIGAHLLATLVEKKARVNCCRNLKDIEHLPIHNAHLDATSHDANTFKAALLALFFLQQKEFEATTV